MAAILLAVAVIATQATNTAHAAEQGPGVRDIAGIHWPRFDPKTGCKLFDFRAVRAETRDGNVFIVQQPSVVLYSQEHTITVTAKTGEYHRTNNSFKLQDAVTARISDPGQTVIVTDDLAWNPATSLLYTDSPVTVTGKDLLVFAEGLELKPTEAQDVEQIHLRRNVRAKISGEASQALRMSAIAGGGAERGEGVAPPPMTILSKGPMTINRLVGTATFSEDVRIRREEFFLRCDTLDLNFDTETQHVNIIHCIGNVNATEGPNGASGDTFTWETHTEMGELTGTEESPAKTWRGDSTIKAPVIRFDERENKVTWSGGVHLHSPPTGSESIFPFGGQRN